MRFQGSRWRRHLVIVPIFSLLLSSMSCHGHSVLREKDSVTKHGMLWYIGKRSKMLFSRTKRAPNQCGVALRRS